MVTRNHQRGQDQNRRRPGEDSIAWTIRTARIEAHANGYWYIHYTVPGAATTGPRQTYRTQVVSTRAKDKARAYQELKPWADAYERDMRAQINQGSGQTTGPTAMTFREAAESYLIETRPRRLTENQEYATRRLLPDLGDEAVAALDTARLSAWHAAQTAAGAAPGTVRNRLEVALTVLRHAASLGVIAAAPRYQLPPLPQARIYALSVAESDHVFATAADWAAHGPQTVDPGADPEAHRAMGLFFCVALDTAQRRGAILGLTWDRVRLDTGVDGAWIDFTDHAFQPVNKRRCARVPLTPRLFAVLTDAARASPTGRAGPMFPRVPTRTALWRLQDTVGLPKLTAHVARHTWATQALASGVPLATVAFVMADNIATIDRTYNHHARTMARDNLKRFLWPAPSQGVTVP